MHTSQIHTGPERSLSRRHFMATNALRPQVPVVRTRPNNPLWDRTFFSSMILVLWALVLYGFSRTYFLAGMVRAPLPNTLIHVHGAAFTLWMVLLFVQTALISAHRVLWHKRLGLFGFGLAVAMVILGLLAATDALRRGSGPLGLSPATFYVIPVTDMVLFGIFISFSYRLRSKPAAHKRLILIATIGLTGAAVGRFPGFFHANPRLQDLVPLVLLLTIALYDRIALGRVQRTTLWAGGTLMVVHLARIPLAFTPAWQAFARSMHG